MRLCHLLSAAAMAACFAALGCSIPVSENPLTDEKTSTLDGRLIGYWRYVPKKKGDTGPPPYVIGRLKDKPNVLEMTWVELDGEGHVTVTQSPLYATKIGEEHYLSISTQERDPDKRKSAFLITRYELDDDTCRLYCMEPEQIVAAIEGGKLKGVVKRSKRKEGADPNEPTNYEEIRITAEPKELAEFLKGQGKTCFHDEPMDFKRTRTE